MANDVFELLDKNRIDYELIEHPPVYTAKEADKYVAGRDVVKAKNLFLKSKQGYFLVILPDDQRLDLKLLRNMLHTTRLQFAKDSDLEEKLGIKTGAVSPFNLINNLDHDVMLVIDSQIVNSNQDIVCHPNDNTKSLILKIKDLLAVVKILDNEVKILNLSGDDQDDE